MNIIIQKETLLKGITASSKALPNNSNMEVLKSFKIDVDVQKMSITGNSIELGIVTVIKDFQSDVIAPMSFLVEAKIFSDIIRKMPEGEITIEVNDNILIKSGKTKFSLQKIVGLDSYPVPVIHKEGEDSQRLVFNQGDFKQALSAVLFSAGTETSNAIMNSVQLLIKDNVAKVSCLDGHRIAIRTFDVLEGEDLEVLLPSAYMKTIISLLDSEDEEFYIQVTKTQVAISKVSETEETFVILRVVNGAFYKIDSMLQGFTGFNLTLDKKELLSLVERAVLSLQNEHKPLIIDIVKGNKVIDFFTETSLCSFNETIESVSDDEVVTMQIGLNPRFVIDVLKNIEDDKVSILLNNTKSPIWIEGATFKYIILPINISNSSKKTA